jgi:ribose transport system permease protein
MTLRDKLRPSAKPGYARPGPEIGEDPQAGDAVSEQRGKDPFWVRLVTAPELSLAVALVLLGLVIQSRNASFLTSSNLILVVQAASATFVVSAAMTFVLVGGGLDLSVGSMSALGAISTGYCLQAGVPVPFSIVAGLVICALFGLFNGIIIAKGKIPALIVSLGALYFIRGIVLSVTGGVQVFPLPQEFNDLGQGDLFGVPFLVIYALVFGIAAHILLDRSKYGYHVRAVGGKPEAARAAGINIDRITISLYVLSALGAGLAGIMSMAQISDGDPSAGQGLEIAVLSAVIVGGTSLFGAVGSITGTALGVLLLAVVTNGLLLMSISPYLQYVALGFIVIGSVSVDQLRRRRLWRLSR